MDLELISEHVVWCRRRNLAESTIYQRTRALSRLRRGLDGVPLAAATTKQIEAALDIRRLQPASRRCEVSHISAFYAWARWGGWRADDPSPDLARPRVLRGLPRPIADDALWRALDLAERPTRTILMLAAFAGLRAKEISGVRAEHALLRQPKPMLLIPDAKGGDSQAVWLHPVLAEELSRALPARGWAFPRLDGRPGPWRPWSISGRANRFLHEEIGVADTLHSLRHWYGTNLLTAADGNVRTAQEGLRHRSLTSTMIYTLIHPGAVADAVAGLPTGPLERAAA